MKFEKSKTSRGFSVLTFYDDYNKECSLQKSSSIEDHIWLGIDDPKEVFVDTRMHLTRKQSIHLAIKLLKFGLFRKV